MPEEASPPIDLPCRDEGTGTPVVLLHGVGGNRTVWNAVVPGLAKTHRVLAPDLRGHGRAEHPAGSHFTFLELEGDVTHLLDRKGIDRAHLVGLSGGAMLALRIALDQPERARSLVMVSGAAYTDNHTRAVADRWSEVYAKEGPDAFALRLLKDMYYPDWIEDHLDFADALRAEVGGRDYTPADRWARAMRVFDERSRVAELRVPTLIVQAMDDAVVDASHGRILRQSIPGSKIRILAQTGHLVPVERPQETVEAISAFLRESETPSPIPDP